LALPDEFDLSIDATVPAAPVLRACGEIDVAVAGTFLDRMLQVVAERPQALLVDLRDVTFIDSSAVSALASARKQLLAQDARLVVIADSLSVRRVLEVLGLMDAFGVVRTTDEALETIRRTPAD